MGIVGRNRTNTVILLQELTGICVFVFFPLLIYTKVYENQFYELLFFFLEESLSFLLGHPSLAGVMSALMGIPCPVMGPCSRTIDSGCANRPSKQL